MTGTVNPPNQRVWLNGRPATVQRDGKWAAVGVPLDRDGVAIFEATAVPDTEPGTPSFADVRPATPMVSPEPSVSVNAVLSSNSIILNASQPTYGTFNLHLTGTAGRSYVISASTNLLDWVPILTNSDSAAAFDYVDTNVTAYGCRFFRVTPLR